LGGDSLAAIKFSILVEDTFGVELPIVVLMTSETLFKVEAFIAARLSQTSSNCKNEYTKNDNKENINEMNHHSNGIGYYNNHDKHTNAMSKDTTNSKNKGKEKSTSSNTKQLSEEEKKSLKLIASGKKEIDWEKECSYPPYYMDVLYKCEKELLYCISQEKRAKYLARSHVLVTGATGFLGPFLLEQLLKKYPKSKIYCLVRGKDHFSAGERTKENANTLNCSLQPHHRIKVLAGDVSKLNLGLSAKEYAKIALSVSTVVHNAAHVHGMLPYSYLKQTNVAGTLRVIKFSIIARKKILNHISSINVLHPSEGHPEKEILFNTSTLDSLSGYAQTKYVSEMLINQLPNFEVSHQKICRKLAGGIPDQIKIFRPATISAHSITGSTNLRCFTNCVICGLIQLGGYPKKGKGIPQYLLLTPVDYVSSAIAELCSTTTNKRMNIYHLVTSKPTQWKTLANFIRSLGYKFKALDPVEWKTRVSEMHPSNPLFVFRDQLLSGGGFVKVSHRNGPQTHKTTKLLKMINEQAFGDIRTHVSLHSFYLSLQFIASFYIIPQPTYLPHQQTHLSLDENEEEISDKIMECGYYRIENWYKDLADYTFPSFFFPFTLEHAQMIKELRHKAKTLKHKKNSGETKKQKRGAPQEFKIQLKQLGKAKTGETKFGFKLVTENEEKENKEMNNLYKQVIQRWKKKKSKFYVLYLSLISSIDKIISSSFSSSGAFVRLSCRSPKDGATKTTKFKQTLKKMVKKSITENWDHLDEKCSTENSNLIALAKTIFYSLKVRSGEEAMKLIIHSDRIDEDIISCQQLNTFPLQVFVRKFVDFDPLLEFRAFVSNSHLLGVTAYHKLLYVPFISDNKKQIGELIFNFWNTELKQKINCEDYAIDFVISKELDKVYVIELNYPPPIADTILFHDFQDILQNGRDKDGKIVAKVVENTVKGGSENIEEHIQEWMNQFRKQQTNYNLNTICTIFLIPLISMLVFSYFWQ